MVGFTTANKKGHFEESCFADVKVLNENKIDEIFRAAIECTEEAVLNSMVCAETTKGRKDRVIDSLKQYMDEIVRQVSLVPGTERRIY